MAGKRIYHGAGDSKNGNGKWKHGAMTGHLNAFCLGEVELEH